MGDEDDEDYGGGGGSSGELKELKTVEDFDQFLDDSDSSVIGAFLTEKMFDPKAVRPSDWDDDEDGEWEAPTIDNPQLVSFKSIASSEYGWRFGFTTAPALLEKMKSKAGGLYLYRSPRYVSKEHGDRPRERYPSDTYAQGPVVHWLNTRAQPLVGEFNFNTKERYTGPVLIIFMNLDFETNKKSVNYVLKRARKVAIGVKDKLSVAVASITSMSHELSDYGLESDKESDILMAITAGSDDSADKYGAPKDKAFSGDVLQAFANSYLKGELTPHKKVDEADDTTADTKEEL